MALGWGHAAWAQGAAAGQPAPASKGAAAKSAAGAQGRAVAPKDAQRGPGARVATRKPDQARGTRAARAQAAARGKGPVKASRHASKSTSNRNGSRKSVVLRAQPARASFGHLYGLQKVDDELDLKSSVALVVDQDTNEVLFSKNPEAVLPIASITKLMTALVVIEAGLSMDETLVVDPEDVSATVGSSSRLRVGTRLSRGEMLHLSLMSSENRAAHVLGRTYPGGIRAFVSAMNAKAQLLGMTDTRYVEPTGLSAENQSSAEDLANLVRAASAHPLIRDLSTTPEALVPVGTRQLQFRNTNGLVRNPEWDIGLQKTGYIAAAGRCLVMQTQLAGRKLIMVLLDSAGKYSRMGDAERIRKWLATAPFLPSAVAAPVSRAAPPAQAPSLPPATATPMVPAVPPSPEAPVLTGPRVLPVALPAASVPAGP